MSDRAWPRAKESGHASTRPRSASRSLTWVVACEAPLGLKIRYGRETFEPLILQIHYPSRQHAQRIADALNTESDRV